MKSRHYLSQLRIKSRTKGTILNSFYGLILFGLVFQPLLSSLLQSAQAIPPTVSTISPNVGDISGGETVTITGSNFRAPSRVEKVSTGVSTTNCVLATNRDVYCWGNNSSGELGTGTAIADSNVPVKVKMDGVLAGKVVTDIDVGSAFSCAVASGKAYCWGENGQGQLGNNSSTDSNQPVAVNDSGVLSGKTVTKVSAGYHHACAIADGQAYCWGNNTYGGLGNNTTTNSPVPVAVNTSGLLSGKTVTDISVGEYFTCAVADSLPYCWGFGQYNRLGRGSNNANTSVPIATEIATGSWSGKTVTKIAVGEAHGCLLASSIAYCWGNNWAGQVGINSTATTVRATPIYTSGALSGKTVTDIAAGNYQGCVIADGQQYCWGYNGTAQLGDNTLTTRQVPTATYSGGAMNGKTVTSIGGVSNDHSCSIASDAIYCSGDNYQGQLGNGNYAYTDYHVASVMSSFQMVYTSVAFGGVNSGNVTYVSSNQLSVVTPAHAAGVVNVTITNPNGETTTVNNGYTYQNSAPTLTAISPTSGPIVGGTSVTITGSNFSLARVSQVSDGVESTSCALAANHDIYCWGGNASGQLGTGTAVADSNIPLKVKSSAALAGKLVTDIDSGRLFSCAVASGKPYCWGENGQGQLGNNSSVDSNEPVAVSASGVLNGKTVTKVSAGFHHACAIADGQAYCWGDNTYGALGNNSTSPSPVPVAVNTSGVLNGKTVTDISTGEYFSCAIADGLPYCWGYGAYNRLGRSSIANSSVPIATEIASGSWSGKTITQISVGEAHGCLLADQQVYCWGNNWGGQVGDGTTSIATQAVAVNTTGALKGRPVTDIAVGPYHSCAIAGGQAYCWGDNTSGQLGDNTITGRPLPTAVYTAGNLSGKRLTGLGGGSTEHGCVIASDALYCTGENYQGGFGNSNYTSSNQYQATTMSSFISTPPDIYLGANLATSISYVSSTQLTASTPAVATPGYVDVRLINARSQTASLTNGYQYLAVVPGAPTGLATTPSQNGVALTWTAPTNNGGASITNYLVEYSSNGGSSWNTFSHAPSAATNITVTGLSAGTTYTFRVSAINSAGTGSPSSTATGTPVYVTLQSDNDISIDITPNGATTVSSNKHTLSLNTNNPNGFQITIEMASGTRNLVNGAHTISPASGSLASPTSLLVNTWGYRIDSAGGFGSGPTVTETNVSSSGYSWAGVPASGNPTTIKSSPTPQLNNTTVVWYGLNASNTKASGSYTGTILYTAIAG